MADSTVHLIRLTRSQQMALIDVLIEHVIGGGTEVFVNCSTDPETRTTVGDLLTLIAANQDFEEAMAEGIDRACPIDNPLRPSTPGRCRYCRCTEMRACPEGCSWADMQQTVCDAQPCLLKFAKALTVRPRRAN